jgi:hypothetical protein
MTNKMLHQLCRPASSIRFCDRHNNSYRHIRAIPGVPVARKKAFACTAANPVGSSSAVERIRTSRDILVGLIGFCLSSTSEEHHFSIIMFDIGRFCLKPMATPKPWTDVSKFDSQTILEPLS